MDNSVPFHERFAGAPADEVIQAFLKVLAEDPERINDRGFVRRGLGVFARACGGEAIALDDLWRRFLRRVLRLNDVTAQRDKLANLLRGLKEQPIVGWVLSPPFSLNGDGKQHVYAMPLGRDQTPQCYRIDDGSEPAAAGEADHAVAATPELPVLLPPPPYLAFLEPTTRLFIRPATGVPPAPQRAEILEVVAAWPECRFEELGEIEVSEGPEDRKVTLLAERSLARDVKRRLEEGGETVSVRAELGVATGIHRSGDRRREDWLEFPDLAGPTVKDLVFPRWLRRAWSRDIKHMVRGRGVKVLLLGPTGVGKTSAVEYAGRDMCRLAARRGVPRKGFAVIRLSGPHIGSSFVHQVERTMYRAVKRARNLVRNGYFAIILADEADALLGEMGGGFEHAHNRSERLAAQELLGQDLEGVAVYLTMNPRRNSWLPAPIVRRFTRREYPRPTRSQIAAVASHYAQEHAGLLKTLGMTPQEFGAAFAMNLFSDRRVVARGYLHSGRAITVRARDLHLASPGKTKELIANFAFDLEEGEAARLDDLWAMMDREFRAGDLSASNFFEVTFLTPPRNDALRTVEPASGAVRA
jgi:hypothetical protein